MKAYAVFVTFSFFLLAESANAKSACDQEIGNLIQASQKVGFNRAEGRYAIQVLKKNYPSNVLWTKELAEVNAFYAKEEKVLSKAVEDAVITMKETCGFVNSDVSDAE